MKTVTVERHALERMVLGAFDTLTGRRAAPLRYAMMGDTPVGALGLAASEHGLCRVDYITDEAGFVERLLGAFGERPVLRDPLDAVRRQLDRYFAGRQLAFDLEVDLSAVHGFSKRVLGVTARIPPGRVLTYTAVAGKAGNPRASRAAGNALHDNPVAIVVPCHRVVRADGSLGGYGGGLPAKEWLLEHEGALPATVLK